MVKFLFEWYIKKYTFMIKFNIKKQKFGVILVLIWGIRKND